MAGLSRWSIVFGGILACSSLAVGFAHGQEYDGSSSSLQMSNDGPAGIGGSDDSSSPETNEADDAGGTALGRDSGVVSASSEAGTNAGAGSEDLPNGVPPSGGLAESEPQAAQASQTEAEGADAPTPYLVGSSRVSEEAVERWLAESDLIFSNYPSAGAPLVSYVSRLAGSDNRTVSELVSLAERNEGDVQSVAAIGAGLAAAARANGASENGYDAFIARQVAASQSPALIAAYEAALGQQATAALGGAGGAATGGGAGGAGAGGGSLSGGGDAGVSGLGGGDSTVPTTSLSYPLPGLGGVSYVADVSPTQ